MYVKKEAPSTKYKCRVAGCPDDKEMGSLKELRKHIRSEHPRCSHCKKTFLLGCLYMEHLVGSETCQYSEACNRKQATDESKQENCEKFEDSGLESMSDSAGEEPVAVNEKKNALGKEEAKSMKRKAEVKEFSEQ